MATDTNQTASKITALRDLDTAPPGGYRTPPHNYEAEQALLGAIIENNLAFERVSEFLRPEHFAEPIHGRIFEAIGKLVRRGQLADLVTLSNFFESDAGLAEIGGQKYLVRLVGSVVTVINAVDYARTIHDRYLRRQIIGLGQDMVNKAYQHDLDFPATDQIESAEKSLFDLASTGQYEGGFKSFESSLQSAIAMAEVAYKREGRLTGVATGLTDLDKLLGGLHRSDLVILAGRPSMGKTALATNIAFHAAKQYREGRDEMGRPVAEDGAVVGFFSLEMSAEQLATRLLAEEAGLPSEKIRRGDLKDRDFQRVVEASAELSRIPLFIDDTAALSISAIRTRARRLKRQHGLGLVVIDYLQLATPTPGTRYDSRVLEISEITRGLKALAKELNVPVLALSQLSRAVEQRDDKRPQLADLRESGSIEQDADVVMFIFREEYYIRRREPKEGTDQHLKWRDEMSKVYNLAELIIAKQRHGPIGKVFLHFDGSTTKFSDHAADDHLPDVRD
ncbi:MAG TPA: replicative DNA helicase [Alphaproteobacteria bacterium]|jgi:replicative DNA helicase|nr:replicative DNA helicase [Alphaproteobacteria bacterium]